METGQLIFPIDKVNCKNIILIDNNVPEFMTFYNSCNNNTFPIVYSKDSSRDSILGVLNKFDTIERLSLCFVNDNCDNKIFLNNQFMLDADNVEFIILLIQQYNIKNIDYLACDLLKEEIWKSYFDNLKKQTNVIVGSSDDKTGNLKFGGDWTMESTYEDIQNIYFNDSILNYSSLLDVALGYIIIVNNEGKIYGAGKNAVGQLGLGDDINRHIFTLVSGTNIGNNKINKVSCGAEFSAALTTDYKLYTTGNNNFGQLGAGLSTSIKRYWYEDVIGSDISNNLIVDIACGYQHILAVSFDGYIYTAGHNLGGQLNNGTNASPVTSFIKTSLPNNKLALTVSCGNNFSYAISRDGYLYSCGRNTVGQLGLNNITNSYFFVIPYNLSNIKFKSVSCGEGHVAAISMDEKLYMTGSNFNGQLGVGDTTNLLAFNLINTKHPSTLLANKKIINVSCGVQHTMVLTNDGLLYGAGSNVWGQLGLGYKSTSSNIFLQATTPVGVNIINVICNDNTTYIFADNGDVYSVGAGSSGQMGDGKVIDSSVFVKCIGISGAIYQYNDIISNICFVAGSVLLTDQGLKEIEKVIPYVNTINNEPILHVTKTYTIDKHLVCINKNALGKNIPNKKTIVSKNHLVMYNKKILPANDLVYFVAGVEFIKNKGEPLYNIILKKHSLMNVNNLIAETLDPKNIIAKSCLGQIRDEEKTILMKNNYENLSKLNEIKRYN